MNGVKSGALGAGEVAQISIDGGTTWTDLSFSGDNWSYTDTRTLLDGSHDYQVRIVDQAGNVGGTDSQTVVVDTYVPTAQAVLDTYTDDVMRKPGISPTPSIPTTPRRSSTGISTSRSLPTRSFSSRYRHATSTVVASVQASVTGTTWTAAVGTLAEGDYNLAFGVIYQPTGRVGSSSNYIGFTVDIIGADKDSDDRQLHRRRRSVHRQSDDRNDHQ